MNYIEEYLKSLTKSASFDPFNFNILTNLPISSINETDPDAIVNVAAFIHEYTHYLQLVTLYRCSRTYIEYLDLISSVVVKIHIMFQNTKKLDPKIWDQYRVSIDEIKSKYKGHLREREYINNEHETKFIQRKVYNKYLKKSVIEVYLYSKINKKWIHLSPFVLMENMATMSYFQLRNIGPEGIVYHFTENISVETDYYIIVYYYFYDKYPEINDLRTFTFYYCELCLMQKETECGLYAANLLRLIEKEIKNEPYNDADKFYNLLNQKYQILKTTVKNASTLLNEITITTTALGEERNFNNFIDMKCYVLEIIERGMKERLRKPSIFSSIMDTRWISKNKERYFSPPIISKDGQVVTLKGDETYFKNIMLIVGINRLLNIYYQNGSIDSCPFHSDLEFCGLENRNDSICLTDSFSVKDINGEYCTFYICSMILGFIDSAEYAKYDKSI